MINIGIVGAGGMGTVHHSNYRHLDGCAVVGVVDPSPAGRERAAQWGVPCYESITDMVEAGGVDVVDICTPTFLHRDNVMESLSLGKTTIVEKPCALTRADAEAMFALADVSGKLMERLEECGWHPRQRSPRLSAAAGNLRTCLCFLCSLTFICKLCNNCKMYQMLVNFYTEHGIVQF